MKNVLKLVKHYSLICIFALVFGAEFFFAQVTGSLVLLLDSYHKLYVLLSLVLLVISCKVRILFTFSLFILKTSNDI